MTDISNALIIYIAYKLSDNNWEIPLMMVVCIVLDMIFKKINGK